MELTLKTPLFILPAFQKCGDHRRLAEELGLVIGPLARERRGNGPEYFVVQVPDGWAEIYDYFGRYLVDTTNRRRIRFDNDGCDNVNQQFSTCAELLTRFRVQEWYLGNGWWMVYVRKIVGNEENIYCYTECNRLTETEIRVTDGVHHGQERSHGVVRCEEWLQKHYPDWRNPLAYWDIQ
ncbi:MAG: hypothetical protein Q7R58_02395 [bacterium]|nr:hypothetical protein [bacterium]